jgi:hypothetical protein
VADSRAAGAVVVVLAVMTLAGCSSSEAGQPTAAPGTPASGSASGSFDNGAGSVRLPPRPKSIAMNGVDPCALLTAAQQAQFQVKPGEKAELGPRQTGATCAFNATSNAAGQGYDIATLTSPGIQTWLDPYRTDHISQVTIAGFPAVDITTVEQQATGCSTAIDVADGQLLQVDNGLIVPGLTQQQSCQKTNAVAEAAMATLQTLK